MSASPIESAGPPDSSATATSAGPAARPAGYRAFLVLLGLGAITSSLANFAPAILTISLKATVIDAAHATSVLSVAVAVGSVCSLIAFPIAGRLSDRCTSRFGRRRPFLLVGAVLFVVGAVLTVVAGDVVILTLGFAATAVGYSSVYVACTAAIPDQLPRGVRGPASAIVGLALPIGVVVGLFIAQLFSPNLMMMILAPAAVGVIGAVATAALLSDRRIGRHERPAMSLRQFAGTFWISPRSAPNYAWAWASRVLLFLGINAVQAYQAIFLLAVLHFTPATVAGAIFLSTLVLTVTAMVFAAIAAKVSDRLDVRKPFVIGSAVIFSAGLVVAAMSQSYGAFLVAMIVIGAGQGVYSAVDIALITLVLPDPDNPAKDLGMMSLANTLPHSIIPAIAPAVLLIGASAAHPQNFAALFVGGAIAGLLGALCILPIRGVR